jgi:hypothetical protein
MNDSLIYTGLTDANTTISFSSVPTSLVIFDAVTIHQDGRVEVNPKYTTDEAAQKFWEAVIKLAPNFFDQNKLNRKIEELNKTIDELEADLDWWKEHVGS